MKKTDVTLLIADETPLSNITYFAGVPLTHVALCITKEGKKLYISPLDAGKKFNIPSQILVTPLLNILKPLKPKTFGIDFEQTSVRRMGKLKGTFPRAKFIDVGPELENKRKIKRQDELDILSEAARIANRAYTKMLSTFDYKTEADVKAFLEYEMAKHGAAPAFPTIVASGYHAATPHHTTQNVKLNKGLCVIDFGANYKGYCSDCTRTIAIGTPTTEQKKVYSIVRKAQEAALYRVKPGVKCSVLDAVTRKSLGLWNKHFIHSLGHGIGLDVHELPNVSAKSKDILQKNMVITIEPGAYQSPIGVRIEDTVVVQDKPKVLTNLTKELVVVK